MTTYEDRQWWSAHKDSTNPNDAGAKLCALMTEMRQRQSVLHENTKRLLSVYQYGYKAGQNTDPEDDVGLDENKSAYNAARNVVETVFSQVIRSRIVPMVLTDGGGYYARRKAKDMSEAIEGEFDECGVDQTKEDVVLDALRTYHGAGAAKVFSREGRVCIEHVPIEDIRFDEAETRYRKPRSCFQTMRMDRFQVADLFAENDDDMRKKILAAPRAKDSRSRVSHDQIDVHEAWHLPSCAAENDALEAESDEMEAAERKAGDKDKPSKDHGGRHVIAVEGCTLVDEPWDRDRFPFAFYVPRRRARSIWGIGMMWDLAAPQKEYEELTSRFQKAHKKMGMAGFFTSRDANINVAELANDVGIAVEFDGQTPPIPFTPQPVHPDQYAYRDSIPANMMQSKGVSPLAAQSQLPAGLQQASGKALQVFNDFESVRNLPEHRELERWHVDLAKLVIIEVRSICAENKKYSTKYRGKRGFKKLEWSKVMMDDDDFVLKVFPVSALSTNPSAKFAQTTEMLKAGAITPEQWRRLQDLPDLEAENELDAADTDIIDECIDRMVMFGEAVVAQSFDNLQLIVQRAGKFYNLYRTRDVPDDRLQLIREYIESAKAEIAKQKALDAQEQASAQQNLVQPGGPPGGAPMPAGPMPMPGMAA